MFFNKKQAETKPVKSIDSAAIEAMNKFCATISFLPDGTVLGANSLFLNAVGYTLEEVKGQKHALFCPNQITSSPDYKNFWPDLAAGKSKEGTFLRKHKDGSDIIYDIDKGSPAPGWDIGEIDTDWYRNTFIPQVQKRGAAIIKARGLSSAASAANAAIDHMRDWALGTDGDDWVSMGIYSDGSYGITEGLIYSFPCRCKDGDWTIVQGLDINDFSRERMTATQTELTEERDAVAHLLP